MTKKSGIEAMTKAELLTLVNTLNGNLEDARNECRSCKDDGVSLREHLCKTNIELAEVRDCYRKACAKNVEFEGKLNRADTERHHLACSSIYASEQVGMAVQMSGRLSARTKALAVEEKSRQLHLQVCSEASLLDFLLMALKECMNR